MKLVQNGTMGVLVNQDDIAKLTTPKAIEDEINRITLGDYEVVVRDHNTVVEPEEYIKYLNELLIAAKAKLDTPSAQTVAAPTQPMPVDDIPVPDEHKLDVEVGLRQRDQIIERLLKAAKEAQKRAEDAEVKLNAASVGNETAKPVYYAGLVPKNDHPTSASIKGPLGDVLRIISGDRKISLFANIAIARGLLGDARAENLIDSIYDEGTYAKFIEALKGDTTGHDNSAEPKPAKSDTK